MTHSEIHRAVGPLRLVFWGALLCVLDFNINGFDVLNDTIGTLLIAFGLWGLSELPVEEPSYRPKMQFMQVVAILAIAHSVYAQLPIDSPAPITFLVNMFGIAKLIAVVLFCMAMMQACGEADLIRATESWVLTRNLFFWIYAIPFGLIHIFGCLSMITGESFHIDLGPMGLLLLPVFVAPLIHFFVSTSRMKRYADTTHLDTVLPT